LAKGGGKALHLGNLQVLISSSFKSPFIKGETGDVFFKHFQHVFNEAVDIRENSTSGIGNEQAYYPGLFI